MASSDETKRTSRQGERLSPVAVVERSNGCDQDGEVSKHRLQEEIADRRQAEIDLAIANQILEAKHRELQGRNIALQQVLSRIEEEKGKLAFQLRTNIDRLVKPILRAID
jgi:hypothetical protein